MSRRIVEPLVAVALAVLTWQTRSLLATAGLDPSWRVGLHLAQTRGVSFGPDFTWTYGPLGFLAFPIAVTGGTLAAAFVFVFATQALLAWAIVRRASTAFGLLPAIAIAYAVLCLPVPPADFLPLTAFVLAVWAIYEPAPWFPVAGGIVAAVSLLTKTNTGAAALAIVVVAAAARGRRRALETLGVALAAFLAGWLLSGNSLLDVPGWLRLSAGLVSGYSSAMQYEQHGLGRDFLFAAIVGVLLAALVLRRRAFALWLITAGFVFAFFKEGFVRHDPTHAPAFFVAVAIAFAVIARRDLWRWPALAGVVLAVVAGSLGGGTDFAPTASAGELFGQLHDVASGSRRAALVERSRDGERRSYQVEPRLLALLRGHTVHVDPWETAAIQAYDLKWRPLPIAQEYSAYTASLDERNADVLASGSAPERVLRESLATTVNQRDRFLEAPATFRAFLCDDVELASSHRWQVLAHHPRCDPPRHVVTIEAAPGQPVAVPEVADDELLFVRVHFHDSVANALRGLLYKPHRPVVALNGGPFTPVPAGAAADGIVLHVPGAVAFDPAFGGALDYRLIAAGGLAGGVRFEFEAERVRGSEPMPRGRRAPATLAPWLLRDDGIVDPRGRLLPVAAGGGFVDYGWLQHGLLVLRGWAADAAAGTPARVVLVFADGKLVYAAPPNDPRPDVAQALGRPALASSGYSALVPADKVRTRTTRKDVRIFAVVGDRALEVQYPLSYGWRRR